MESTTAVNSLACLFCYQSNNNISDLLTKDLVVKRKSQQRFFTLIKRQMLQNIRGSAIGKREVRWCRNSIRKHISIFSDKSEYDYGSLEAIHFCERCEISSQKFCELYNKVEQLKLQIDCEIRNLCNVMRSADKLYLPDDDTKTSIESCHNSLNDDLKTKIRKTLKQSFKAYYKIRKAKSFPRVQMSPFAYKKAKQEFVPSLFDCIEIDETPTVPETLEYDLVPTAAQDVKTIEPVMDVEYTVSKFEPDITALIDLPPSPPLPILKPIQEPCVIEFSPSSVPEELPVLENEHSNITYSKLLKPSLAFQCPKCLHKVNTKFNLFQHSISHHIDHYFISVKLKGFSMHRFKNCIISLLTKLTTDSKKIDSKFECLFCDSKLRDRKGLKYHLILKHRTILEERLVELQNSNSVLSHRRSFPKRPPSSWTIRSQNCSACSNSYLTIDHLKRHQCSNHPEIYFEDCRNLSLDKQIFTTCVKHVLSQQYFSIKVNQPLRKHNRRMQCRHCDRNCWNSGDMKLHIVIVHHDIILQKIEYALRNWKTGSILKFTTSRQHRNVIKRRTTRAIKIRRPVKHHTCPLCNKIFKKGFHLNQHQSFEHAELFFESSNFLWADQNNTFYKAFVDKFLTEEISHMSTNLKNDTENRENKQFKCTICLKALRNLRFAKNHLVLRHRKILAGKLEHLQSSEKSRHDFEKELECVQISNNDVNFPPQSSFSSSIRQNICKICSKRYRQKYSLNDHVALHHPTQFFEWTKRPSLTIDQFSDFVHKMLSEMYENFDVSVDKIDGALKWLCPLCPTRITGSKQNMKSHVLMCHESILCKKLKQAQENVEPKLDMGNQYPQETQC